MRFKAKKSLGQHFLNEQSVLKIVIETANLTAKDTVLEIGPGTGVLTNALLVAGARVIAMEKDDRLIPFLQRKFSAAIRQKRFELIHSDILKFDLSGKLQAKTYKLIANIPYYLTGQLLRQFLSGGHQPTLAVLMFQKEVAERIVAKDGRESILSISVKAYGQPHYLQTVCATSFRPRPKVDSAIVLIDKISRDNFREVNETKFFEILKRGFAGKRKMLKNNLAAKSETLAACRIEERARAENLTLEQWLCLAKHYS